MRAWIDVDNPPQVQYLCPFVQHLNTRKASTPLLTVRNYGSTVELVRKRGLDHAVFGSATGAGKLKKGWKTGLRALALVRHVLAQRERPDYLISSSRSSALAARILGLPAYIFCDYEHAELGIYRRFGATILFPEVIGRDFFRKLGFADGKLLPFPGLKEDISFSFIDIDDTAPLAFETDGDPIMVLLRPPATQSHYYVGESGSLYHDIIADLAERGNTQVILSPRYPQQADELLKLSWERPPIVLDNKADFVALLKAMDVVVSSGGTMLREAAFLGPHACSIFMGPKGAVDQYLEGRGLLTYARDIESFRECRFAKKADRPQMEPDRQIVGMIVDEIEKRIAG